MKKVRKNTEKDNQRKIQQKKATDLKQFYLSFPSLLNSLLEEYTLSLITEHVLLESPLERMEESKALHPHKQKAMQPRKLDIISFILLILQMMLDAWRVLHSFPVSECYFHFNASCFSILIFPLDFLTHFLIEAQFLQDYQVKIIKIVFLVPKRRLSR